MITVCLRFRLHFLTLNWFWLNSTYFDFVHTEVVRWSRILFLFESKQSIDFNSARDALQLWSLNCVSFKKNDKKNVDVIWPIRLNDQFALFFFISDLHKFDDNNLHNLNRFLKGKTWLVFCWCYLLITDSRQFKHNFTWN